MKRYVYLNQKYYTLSYRLAAHTAAAKKIYKAGYIVPTYTILSINKMKKEVAQIEAEMRALEERFCDLFPFEFIVKMINNGATLNI